MFKAGKLLAFLLYVYGAELDGHMPGHELVHMWVSAILTDYVRVISFWRLFLSNQS